MRKTFAILGIILIIFSNSLIVNANLHSQSIEDNETKEWTYMKYIVADHIFSLPSLKRLKNYAESDENLNIVVLQDTYREPGKL